MRTVFKYAVIILLAYLFGACSKGFLELKPPQSTETHDAIKELPGLRSAINGVYSLLQNENYYGRTMPLLPDLRADNEFISVINSNRYRNHDQYIVTANDSYTTDSWNLMYSVVANANMIITHGPHISLLPAKEDSIEATKIVAEAYALRALVFFDLCRLFAQPYNYTAGALHLGIPIVTITKIDSVQSPARSNVKDTYNQIISDLNNAISNFEKSGSSAFSSGRINIYSAKALLSRVLLYKEDWNGALEKAEEVVNSKKYSLLTNEKLVNDFKMIGNGETIFEIINTAVDNRNTDGLSYIYSQEGYGDVLATNDVFNIYSGSDVRLGFLTKGKRAGNGGENPANIITKYSNVTTFAEAIKVMRYAELLLIKAEAEVHLGLEDKARADLNIVVQRADVNAIPVTATGAKLLDLILLERRKELAFEGHRLFDLIRNKRSFTKYLASNKIISVEWPSTKVIQPIPQRELDANPNIRNQQNEGYN
ncbi:RagB/SusD family nutrient uptake outer membrane protein [Chitinophaga silvatica]|uniref:RagB/SusD family nutrient uptake outer membrane protein n=1 Tax=Chitinophaga silvatica TaxID=2282649 RepID=A0A3E1Y2F5_9BACT|nr:RagB/SusD family nutrient uptake outer membrane protein [Chitinophaga silvatica]RFS18844.1 RagB/SusD family nutrient uptake outer membrane protein [Chitinophaga silvatica]